MTRNFALILETRNRNEFSSNEGQIALACVFRSLFKARTGNLLERILFEVLSCLHSRILPIPVTRQAGVFQ